MKAKRFGFEEGQDYRTARGRSGRVQAVQGLRASSAASPQERGNRRQNTRATARAAAIRASQS